MTSPTAIPNTATQRASAMSPERKLAIATGVLFFITHVTSVTAIVLYQPVLDRPGHVLGNGAANSRILLGGIGVCVVPVFAWEVSLAAFLILKGFRSTAAIPSVPSDERQPQLAAA